MKETLIQEFNSLNNNLKLVTILIVLSFEYKHKKQLLESYDNINNIVNIMNNLSKPEIESLKNKFASFLDIKFVSSFVTLNINPIQLPISNIVNPNIGHLCRTMFGRNPVNEFTIDENFVENTIQDILDAEQITFESEFNLIEAIDQTLENVDLLKQNDINMSHSDSEDEPTIMAESDNEHISETDSDDELNVMAVSDIVLEDMDRNVSICDKIQVLKYVIFKSFFESDYQLDDNLVIEIILLLFKHSTNILFSQSGEAMKFQQFIESIQNLNMMSTITITLFDIKYTLPLLKCEELLKFSNDCYPVQKFQYELLNQAILIGQMYLINHFTQTKKLSVHHFLGLAIIDQCIHTKSQIKNVQMESNFNIFRKLKNASSNWRLNELFSLCDQLNLINTYKLDMPDQIIMNRFMNKYCF